MPSRMSPPISQAPILNMCVSDIRAILEDPQSREILSQLDDQQLQVFFEEIDYFRESDIPVINLLNSAHFFLDWVIIVVEDNHHRLLVYHNGRLLTDRYFKTLNVACDYFSDFYRHRAAAAGRVTPFWGEAVLPSRLWLEMRINEVKKSCTPIDAREIFSTVG